MFLAMLTTNITSSLLRITFILLAFSAFQMTAFAQFVQDPATLHITTDDAFNDNTAASVGIGTDKPISKLTVRGGVALTYGKEDFNYGYMRANDAGDFAISARSVSSFLSSTAMPNHLILQGGSSVSSTQPFGLRFFDGNVGIGTHNPDEAKLVLKGASKATTLAMFGQGQRGISLIQNWPGVAFNSYHTAEGWKSMTKGFGMVWHCDPDGGSGILYMSGQADAANQPINHKAALIVSQSGALGVGGVNPEQALDVNGWAQIRGSDIMLGKGDGRPQKNNLLNRAVVHFPAASPTSDNLVLNFAGDFEDGVVIHGPGLAIGNNSYRPAGYQLAVHGRAICEEVTVRLRASWPDYVFKPGYELRPLSEVAAHIEAKGHLPGIPAAAVVEKEGLELGTMQTKMMEKIEELTLYLIEQNKRIGQLEQEVAALKNQQ
jgi:hypothetical protein